MIHLVFLFHLFSLMVGGIAITVALLRFLHYRNILIIKFALVLTGTELIMMGLAVTLYSSIVKLNLYGLSRMLDSFGVILLAIFMPLLISPLFKFGENKLIKWIHIAICFIIGILLLGYYRFSFPEISARIGQALFFSTIIFPLIGAVIRKKHFVGSSHFKRSLHLLFLSLAIVLPIVILDASGITVLPHDTSVGLLMIILCINAIRIAWSDLTHPLSSSYVEKVQSFCEMNKLTEREKDIVEALGEGLTNREIGELLFISPKTVENHLSKIYQKSEVDNRYQLIQELNR